MCVLSPSTSAELAKRDELKRFAKRFVSHGVLVCIQVRPWQFAAHAKASCTCLQAWGVQTPHMSTTTVNKAEWLYQSSPFAVSMSSEENEAAALARLFPKA